MKDTRNEFHLEKAGDAAWDLVPFHTSAEYRHEKRIRQPGEPTASAWEIVNPDGEQPLRFRLRAAGDTGSVVNPRLVIDRYREVSIPVRLGPGESIVCDGTPIIRVYDSKGRQSGAVELKAPLPLLASGKHIIVFDCGFEGVPAPGAVVTFTTKGSPERIPGSR